MSLDVDNGRHTSAVAGAPSSAAAAAAAGLLITNSNIAGSLTSVTELERESFLLTWMVRNVKKVIHAGDAIVVSSTVFSPNKYSAWQLSLVRETEMRRESQYWFVHANLKRCPTTGTSTESGGGGSSSSSSSSSNIWRFRKLQVLVKSWIEAPTRKGKHYVYKPRQLFEMSVGDTLPLRLCIPETRITKRDSEICVGKYCKDLAIKCKLTICNSLSSVSFEKPTTTQRNIDRNSSTLSFKKHFLSDMSYLMTSGTLADVKFKVSESEHLLAHRCVLSARCDYYKTMFDQDKGFRESILDNETGVTVVNCSDIHDPNSLRTLLRYIYTDEFMLLDSADSTRRAPTLNDYDGAGATRVAQAVKGSEGLNCDEDNEDNEDHFINYIREVFYLADKTGFTSFLELAEKEVMSKITPSNAVRLLEIGDTFNARTLKLYVMAFIKDNSSLITRSEAWRDLIRARPHLCADFLSL